MVEGRRKSRRYRRVFVKTPGGKNKIHYRQRKPSRAHCAGCGTLLHGMKAVRAKSLQTVSKTAKRPERPYGGELCSTCTRRTIIAKSRQ